MLSPVLGRSHDLETSRPSDTEGKRNLAQQQPGSSSGDSDSSSSSSSGSDSESASSSSDGSGSPHCSGPEPEPPSSNKWQLDKWLNKVNPKKTPVNGCDDVGGSENSHYHGLKDTEQACVTIPEVCPSVTKDAAGKIPFKEEQRPRTANKTEREKAQATPTASTIENVVKKSTTLVRTGQAARLDTLHCHQSEEISLSQEILAGICELSKSRLPCSNIPVCKKEPRHATAWCERRRTRKLLRLTPKSKEFTEPKCSTFSPSSDLRGDSEQEPSNLPKHTVAPAANSQRQRECGSHRHLCASVGSTNGRTPNDIAKELEEQLYTLVPFGRNELVSSPKDNGTDEVKSLWVQIDLTLLSRIPYHLPFETVAMTTKALEGGLLPRALTNGAESPRTKSFPKCRRKRKCGAEENGTDQKRNQVGARRCSSPMTASTDSVSAISHCDEYINNLAIPTDTCEKMLQSPASPLPDNQRQYCSDGLRASRKPDSSILQPSIPSPNKNHQTDRWTPPLPVDVCNRTIHICPENTHVKNQQSQREPWLPTTNGQKYCRRTRLIFDDTPRRADFFMQEAKRMKHKADAMMEKFGKALKYTAAALSFIECGNALERGPVESKSPYTMYSETVELLRYAMRLKTHSGPRATPQEKQLAALCYRCLALLYWRMFRLKRDHAVKYSKALIEYFKSSAKVAKAPSPGGANGKSTGTPSPLSPSPSPVNSTGSQGSVSSAPIATSIISIPQRVHQMAANHVSITNSILHSYDYWEIADNLAKENIEFFNDLDSLMGPITLHSSMDHLVQYTRQGLNWVQSSSHFS